MPSILTITCDELDDMRVKLLAAVLTSGWQGDMAQDALIAAQTLGRISASMETLGESFDRPMATEVGGVLYLAAREKLASRQSSK